MCFAPRKPKTTVFTMFLDSGNKNHCIYNVFGQCLAQTLVFTEFPTCYKKYFFMLKSQTHCKLQCFGSALTVHGGGGWVWNEQQAPE